MLRIEDTDRERSTEENVEQILDALHWLELDWDEGPVSQASRAERHAEALQQLLDSGAAYRDSATAKDVEAWKAEHGADRGYRGEPVEDAGGAVRLRVPDDGETVVHDLIRGPVSFPNRSYDDFVIARGDGSVLYNFAVAVDDAEMGITEVVRGDDHLSNTPEAAARPRRARPRAAPLRAPAAAARPRRQEALQAPRRRLGAGAARGRLPAGGGAQLPRPARLGHRRRHDGDGDRGAGPPLPGRGRRRSAAIFDEKKLRWLNGRFMRELPLDEYTAAVARHLGREPDERLRAACAIAQEKAQTLDEVWDLIRFLFEPPVDDEKAWAKVMKDGALAALEAAASALAEAPAFDAEAVEAALNPLPEQLGAKPGKVYQPIRVAITGTSVSPGIFESLAALGREESLARIDAALARLRS